MKLIGVIHLLPLPGSPRGVDMKKVLTAAREDAQAYVDGGANGLIVENYGDVPFYPEHVEPVTVAAMTRAVDVVKAVAGRRPIGVNVLRNDAASALSIAHVCDADFIRVNVHVGAAVTDQGLLQGRAAETMRLRSALDCGVKIWADVLVKHGQPLGPAPDPAREASDAVKRGLADALIVTGPATGEPPDPDVLAQVRRAAPKVGLLAGSGVQPDLIEQLAPFVNGAIVGTWVKRQGRITNRVDKARVAELRRAMDAKG